MDVRLGLVALLMLATHLACDARHFVSPNLSGEESAGGNVVLCSLCELYTTMALDYLGEKKTQTAIINALHQYCLQMHSLKNECIILVDQYAPLFFSEISLVEPQGFCKTIGLCKDPRVSPFPSGKQNKCDLCHKAIDEVLLKLEDPDTKLEIMKTLFKACTAVENYMNKCKTMVFEFAPVILSDAEKFIRENDICTKFHACIPSDTETSEVLEGKIKMVTSSLSL